MRNWCPKGNDGIRDRQPNQCLSDTVEENPRKLGLVGYMGLYQVAVADVQQAASALQRNFSDQFHRRAFVRALFAFIEADVWGRKTVAAHVHEEPKYPLKPLTIEELSIANERPMPILNEDGTVRSMEPRFRLKGNLRFSFRVFAATFGVRGFSLQIEQDGWPDLGRAIKIRDRLMHPKGGSDFMVTDEEVEVCMKALAWYRQETERLNTLAAESLEAMA